MRWGAVTVAIIAVSAPSSHALAIDDAEALALV